MIMRIAFLYCLLLLSFDGFAQKEYLNIVYTTPPQLENPELQALNLIIPENIKSPPLFIWIGGGAWSYVDRHGEMELARNFAKNGIAVATIGHRLSSATWKDPKLVTDNQHPDHINDLAAAVNWLVRNAGKYGYDAEKLFIGGYSSGAQLAALLCLDPSYLQSYHLEPTIFSGVIPVAGAYDIAHYREAFLNSDRRELAGLHVEAVFGKTPEGWKNASPTSFIQNHVVPMLLISESGTYNYTQELESKMKYKPGFEVYHYTDFDHAGLWKDLSFADDSNCRNLILDFIARNTPEQSVFD